MNRHFFKEIKIKNVRGIDEATLKDLSGVNLLLGGNNGGKTSVLEAISLLNCSDAYDFINASSMRNGLEDLDSIPCVRFLFKTHSDSLSVSAERASGESANVQVKYRLYQTAFSKDVFLHNDERKDFESRIIDRRGLDGKEMSAISLDLTINEKKAKVDYLEADFLFGRIRKRHYPSRENVTSSKIIYVSPSEHFSSLERLVSRVLESSDYKALTIELMKLIEPSFEDILINMDSMYGTHGVYVKTRGEDPVPISLFGDGAKKALMLACYIAKAKGGVLLIDEIETSLHHSLYDNLFRFLIKASKHFGVQLFITTHSQEVIDCFLKATEEEPKALKCYTIRKDEKGVSVRDLDHSEVQKYGELGIEVRD